MHICAVGRLRGGPERELVDDYLARAEKTGRGVGLGPFSIHEVEDKKARGMSTEADLLRGAVPKNAKIIILDERGKNLSSIKFADGLAAWRDQGTSDVALLIGGADGLDPSLRQEADLVLSFGAMVWPHMLVRVMVAEQLFRAASILAGTPYHRA